jgi:hypothetical protein
MLEKSRGEKNFENNGNHKNEREISAGTLAVFP